MSEEGRVEGGEKLRIFLGLPLPDSVAEQLAAWQEAELRGRIVPPGNLHVTLAFLGARPRHELPDIARELRDAARAARKPILSVLRYRETRSVGMLVFEDVQRRAGDFARDLHGRLERLGVYEPEERPWLPHVTVLRFREQPRLQPALPGVPPFSPSEAAVYHSLLRPTGAQYEILESVALGG